MIRVQRLFESSLATVDRVDHPPDVPHVDPPEEVSDRYTLNVMERGHFHVDHDGRTWTVDANALFVTIPGQINRYRHTHADSAPDDVCLAVGLSPLAYEELIAGASACLAARAPVLALSNRRAYLRHRLIWHLERHADTLTFDAIAGELLHATISDDRGHRFKTTQLSWYARRVDGARHTLDDDYASDHTLAHLARDAGMSPFHFARVFRELTGLPPHRYLLQRRLRAAANRLRGGASVTDACFAVGFSSLSHFIHAFRRQFGVVPSRFTAGSDTKSS